MTSQHRREIWVAIAIAVLFAALAIARPEYFGRGNLIDLFLANLSVLIIAAGMTLVMLAGEIDISVGSVFAVCAVSAGVLAKAGLPLTVVFAAVCAIGALRRRRERIARRLSSPPVHRRDARDDDRAARRAALDHPGRLGSGSPPGFPVDGIVAARVSVRAPDRSPRRS